MMAVSVLLVFPFIGTAAQPANTYNVVVDGGAAGDGVTDDTSAINAAVAAAYSQGKDVYFPDGDYLISGTIGSLDGVSFYGEADGLSVIKAVGSFQTIGDTVWGNSVDNINIEDLHFLNVGISYAGGYYKSYYAVRRCIFMVNDAASDGQIQLNWQYIQDGLVEYCLFLRQSNCQGVGISNYKTLRCEVRENVWGLDLNHIDWLATEWTGYSAWSNLLVKLDALRSLNELDWDQGRFKCAYYPNRVVDEKIYENIFNGSPYYDDSVLIRDHVVYTKDYTNLEVVGNWMRGWPMSPAGGLKLRNAYGPAVVAANHFVNTPLLQYTYQTTDVPEVYENVMIYRNYFTITPDADETYNRRGISYWEDAAIGGDANIQYHENVFNCEPNAPNANINITYAGNPAEHIVYNSNVFEGTTNLIPYVADEVSLSYTTGAPTNNLSAYAAYPAPMPDIPEYGAVVAFEADFSGETISSLTANGWTFSEQTGVESVGLTSESDLMGADKDFLRIGGNSISQPYGQVSFGDISKGRLTLKTFTSSSYSNARIELLDSLGNVLFAFRLTSPIQLSVENTVIGYTANPMLNSATHNLLSAGNSITVLSIEWDGTNCFWRALNMNADSGEAIMNTGFVKDSFGSAGIPSQIRFDTETYNNTARIFGVTDIKVTEPYVPPTVTLLEDGFESSFDLWIDGGTTDWDRDTSQKNSGSYSAHAGSADNDLISDNLDTAGYSSMTIEFWYRDDDIDDGDDIYLQLYNGSSYINQVELGNSTEDQWHFYQTTIENSGADAVYFRSDFRLKFEGTSIDKGENLWIDDVKVTVQ